MAIGSLFSGIGGLDLGLEMCGLGPIAWQAENDPYAQAVLRRHWPDARLYDDVRKVDHEATPVDLVCGGFPCTDISNAGTRAGIDGEHSGLWSEFARVIRVVRPRFVFVENVAALLARGMDRVLGDLSALGYDAEWSVFRASDVGAPHRRKRIFILAHADAKHIDVCAGARADLSDVAGRGGRDVADAGCIGGGARRSEPEVRKQGQSGVVDGRDSLGNADEFAQQQPHDERAAVIGSGLTRQASLGAGHRFPPGPFSIRDWDGPQPAVRRGADGLSRRVDRLRCLGNAVVPQQAALAFRTLMDRVHSVRP